MIWKPPFVVHYNDAVSNNNVETYLQVPLKQNQPQNLVPITRDTNIPLSQLLRRALQLRLNNWQHAAELSAPWGERSMTRMLMRITPCPFHPIRYHILNAREQFQTDVSLYQPIVFICQMMD